MENGAPVVDHDPNVANALLAVELHHHDIEGQDIRFRDLVPGLEAVVRSYSFSNTSQVLGGYLSVGRQIDSELLLIDETDQSPAIDTIAISPTILER